MMRKAAYVTGTIGIIILVSTLFLKLHHEEGAGFLLKYGTLFNCIIVLPVIGIHLLMGKSPNKEVLLYGTMALFLIYAGVFFKLYHWMGSEIIHGVGTVLFIIFSILFASILYKSQKG
jgi:hypothetical protein